ncbi:MAG: hypothetical protein RIS35_2482 [Pseudomonadota bacterium]|jgi:hypothetical protein
MDASEKKVTSPTPLLAALRACTVDEQFELARLAGTKRNYLYQLASCHRKQPNVRLAEAICNATAVLNKRTDGRVPVLTTADIATMCVIAHQS